MFRTSLIAVTLAVVGCGRPRERVSAARVAAALTAATSRGEGARVALAEPAGGGWRRVYIFGPYTPPAAVGRCLGRAAAGVTQDIESRDDANLLVFEFPDGQVEGLAVPRSAGNFAPEALRRAYSPDQAVFAVRRPPPGTRGNLTPAGGLTNRCS